MDPKRPGRLNRQRPRSAGTTGASGCLWRAGGETLPAGTKEKDATFERPPRTLKPSLASYLWLGLLFALASGASAQSTPLSEDSVRAVVDHVAVAVITPTYGAVAREALELKAATEQLAEAPWPRRSPPHGKPGSRLGALGAGRGLHLWPGRCRRLRSFARLVASQRHRPGCGPRQRPRPLARLHQGVHGQHSGLSRDGVLALGRQRRRTPDSLSARDLSYLNAVAGDVALSASALYDEWARPGGYADVLRAAGTSEDALYPRVDDALYELLMGVLFIVDEVQAEKLNVPLRSGTGRYAESRFSGTSKDDIQNNLLSVLHVYTGSLGEGEGPGLGSLVAAVEPALDTRFRDELRAALVAVDHPGPSPRCRRRRRRRCRGRTRCRPGSPGDAGG